MGAYKINQLPRKYSGNTPKDHFCSVITNQPGFISTVLQELEVGVAYGSDALGRRVSREEIVDLEASLGIERYGSRKNRESYLYDGLGFDVLAEGRDATKTESSGGWYTRSGRDFTPTTEYPYAGGTTLPAVLSEPAPLGAK